MLAKFVRVPLQVAPQLPPETAVVPDVSLKFHCATRLVVEMGVSPLPVLTHLASQVRLVQELAAVRSMTGEV